MATIADLVVNVRANTTGLQRVGGAMSRYVTLPIIAGVGLTVKALARIETIGAQTEAVLESTGGAANVTAGHLETMAGKMERLTSVEAETIQEGGNLLLTFRNIQNQMGKGNKVFDRTLAVITDMSVALGQDMKSGAIQVGKALQDPTVGLTALRRVGVSFSEQQSEQILQWHEHGETLKAQKAILKELSIEFGGSARAMGTTMAGQAKIAMHELGALAEQVVSFLIPALRSAVTFIGGIARAFQGLSPQTKAFILGALGVLAVIGPLILVGAKLARAVMGIGSAFAFVTRLLRANPYLALIAATVALVVIIVKNWDKIKGFLIGVWNALKSAARTAWNAVKDAVLAVVGPIVDAINAIIDAIKAVIQWFENLFKKVAGMGGFAPIGGGVIPGIPGGSAPSGPGPSFPSISPRVAGINIAGDVVVEANDADEFAESMANVGRSALNRRGL